MESKLSYEASKSSGFTLLETLVALTIASLLIAVLIPISRDTGFRISRLDDTSRLLSALQRTILDYDGDGSSPHKAPQDPTVKISKLSLPRFNYDNGESKPWQPVIVTIEASSPSGMIQRLEFIRLERLTQ